MKNFFSIFLLAFLLSNCSDSNHSAAPVESLPDTMGKKIESIQVNTQTDNLQSSKILGTWTNHLTENATFDIQKDSVFYVDEMQSYPYKIVDKKIIIHYPDYKYEATVSWIGDTLVMTDKENGSTKFTRFKD